MSLSARRAWIENVCLTVFRTLPLSSLSARRAWIENIKFVNLRVLDGSLSARRAWIEKLASRLADMSNAVALRKESVDRKKNF